MCLQDCTYVPTCNLVCVSGTSIVFDMSLTYILVALLAVILNNVLVERLSMHTRITVGKSSRQSSNCEKNSAVTHLLMALWDPQGLSGQNAPSENGKTY